MQHFSLNGFDVRFFESAGSIYFVSADINKAFGFEGKNTTIDNVSRSKYETFILAELPARALVIEFPDLLRAIIRSTKPEVTATSDALVQMLAKSFSQTFNQPQDIPALPAATDTDRDQKLATTAANRYQPSAVPKDAIKLPGWLTVSEMLISIGEDPTAEFALIKDNNFRYWINRQMSDIYRAQFGDEPPTVQRKHGSGYCYPKTFVSLVTLYRSNWLAINS